MKKLFRKLMLLAMSAIAFTACEDVPTPYDIPGTGQNVPGTSTEIEGATGEGTLESPFNAAAALNKGKELAAGETTADYYYIQGKVVSIKEQYGTEYGNGTFYISEDGTTTNQFYVYQAMYLGNSRFASGDAELQIGDEVVVCSKITNYNGTIETVKREGFLYSLNGENRGGEVTPSTPGVATGDGTLENPFNAVAANEEAAKLASETASAQSYYIKGKVAKIAYNYGEGKYPASADYYISDDGNNSNTFYVYGSKYLGNVSYSSGDVLKVGDEVIVYGQLYNYKGTMETATNKSYLYSLNGKTGDNVEPTPTPQPSGESILPNGDFESWTDGLPDNWKSSSTASTAKLSQSTDAHSGSYAVMIAADEKNNKRLATTEITLKAGTYTFAFYAKSTTENAAQLRPGYVPVTAGSVGSYAYGEYASITNTEWTQVSHTFTLGATTTVCLVIMSPKSSDYATSQDILVDDATLQTANGGIENGQEEPNVDQPTGDTYKKVTAIASGKYVVAAKSAEGEYVVAQPLSKSYGYLDVAKVSSTGEDLKTDAANEFVFTAVDGGYTIQDASGKYYYMKDNYNSFNVQADIPSEGHVWSVTFEGDNVVIKNVLKEKILQYSSQYTSYGAYSTVTNTLPTLFKK